ncbi:MAG TPA: hypothetical protein VLI39_00920 [Sedimentisphaerales bacterium]|nr:hypothetical protein [Sedimentisphaerales bacterium]
MTLPVPVPGFDVGFLWEIFSKGKGWFVNRRKRRLARAWRQAQPATVYAELVKYYEQDKSVLFSYPGTRYGAFRVPLYVRPQWTNLSTSSLTITFDNKSKEFEPGKSQSRFWEFYRELKELEDYDDDVFRPVKFETGTKGLRLAFELGKFSHACMSQYILEHELLVHLAKTQTIRRSDLPLRNHLLAHPGMIQEFANTFL